MTPKFYAGIGSRKTPPVVLEKMTRIAERLEALGYTLRSGGAEGADTAFAAGAKDKILYLPWPNFNGMRGTPCGDDPRLRKIAEQYHPCWNGLTRGGQALMARNVAQVLGANEGDAFSDFVVCWTKGGKGGGGTGQAIRIARDHQIPVFDLALPYDEKALSGWLKDKLAFYGIDAGLTAAVEKP